MFITNRESFGASVFFNANFLVLDINLLSSSRDNQIRAALNILSFIHLTMSMCNLQSTPAIMPSSNLTNLCSIMSDTFYHLGLQGCYVI